VSGFSAARDGTFVSAVAPIFVSSFRTAFQVRRSREAGHTPIVPLSSWTSAAHATALHAEADIGLGMRVGSYRPFLAASPADSNADARLSYDCVPNRQILASAALLSSLKRGDREDQSDRRY
jgi:hypothetical protein